jgi:hypothetical protein
MAVFANISVDQGSSFTSIIVVEGVEGLIVNLEDYTVRGQIRKTYASLTAVNFTAEIISEDSGEIEISLTAAQTRAMKPGRYVYDVEVIDDTNIVTRVVEGQIEINPAVTRP